MRSPVQTLAARIALAASISLAWTGARAEEPQPDTAELERLYDTVSQLERRIAELESGRTTGAAQGGSGRADWSERIRLSGSAELDYLQGQDSDYGLYDEGSTQVYDARIFVDADLGSDVQVGERTAFRDAGFTFE